MKKIAIFGVGALGSNLAMAMRSLKDLEISLIDKDVVERKNVSIQAFDTRDVLKKKATTLANKIKMFYDIGNTRYFPLAIEYCESNANMVISYDLIIDTLDNMESRSLLWNQCKKYNRESIHGALSADGYGLVVWQDNFKVGEKTGKIDTCTNEEATPMISMTVSALFQAVSLWLLEGEKVNFSVSKYSIRRV